MAAIAAQRVDGLMRRDGIKPGAHGSARLILGDLREQLQKRVLKNVVGEIGVAQVTAQVAIKLAFVTAHQHTERLALPTAKTAQEFLVRTAAQRVGGAHKTSIPSTANEG